ncbi:hypothetical protein ACLOJK_015353 [Asimina triloba]
MDMDFHAKENLTLDSKASHPKKHPLAPLLRARTSIARLITNPGEQLSQQNLQFIYRSFDNLDERIYQRDDSNKGRGTQPSLAKRTKFSAQSDIGSLAYYYSYPNVSRIEKARVADKERTWHCTIPSIWSIHFCETLLYSFALELPYEGDRSVTYVGNFIRIKLRNLVWATSKHDVYLMSHFSVIHWSAITCNKTEVLNVSGHVAPCEMLTYHVTAHEKTKKEFHKHPGSLLEGFTQTQVSTLAVKDNLLVAGGFQGELICKLPNLHYAIEEDCACIQIGQVGGLAELGKNPLLKSSLDRPGVSFCSRTTYDDNAITNAVEIYHSLSGSVHFMASNNDCGVRDFDMEKFQQTKHFRFPWPVNHTSLSPDRKLLVIVGDNPDGMLVDSHTGKTIKPLRGHLDYSFASAWHPDGRTFATGNQDKTCRIWDIRNLSKSISVLKGNLGAIRSIRFTSDGQFMAMAEPADFVHVYDVQNGYDKEQEIDFFGEISGVSFSPDTESLFIGVWDRTYGSLLRYSRARNYSYLDSLL